MENQLEPDLSDNKHAKVKKSSILILSNGHGEDLVASKIVSSIFTLFPDINIKVYPLVGLGEVFSNQEFKGKLTILNPRQVMPSGGFCMQSITSFFKDINHGLLKLILNQYKVVKSQEKNTDLIIAVGDSYPLILSWLSGSDFGYIQTKKSDYSWINNKLSINNLINTIKGTEWNLLEIFFCRSRRSQLVATRDEVSSKNLKKWKINAITSNPMLSKLTKNTPPLLLKQYERLIILPGSRVPELYDNFKRMLKIIKRLNNRSKKMIFL